MKTIGIFGGTFDPIHTAHLIMAQDAAEFANLDAVLIMPTANPPLRANAPVASANNRKEMAKNAIAGNSLFELCTLDLESNGTNYSIDVVEKIAMAYPDAQLYWILGADQIEQLDKWHRIEELSQKISFLALQRPGYSVDAGAIPDFCNVTFAPTHQFDISASEIRYRIQNSLNVKYFLPPEVFEYIKARSLYL
ncbi:nicotinate-nucleotide adenylyltransferase [Puniceicoccaceae bacterium K14]|nr:nicotinate-nucleotide adenylyltransferase [Puniceicoccaceae bacterium K14]